jgi:hypothetical protein
MNYRGRPKLIRLKFANFLKNTKYCTACSPQQVWTMIYGFEYRPPFMQKASYVPRRGPGASNHRPPCTVQMRGPA